MSRDWTPRELFYANKRYNFRNQSFVLQRSDGKEYPLGPSKREKELYPNLSFLGEGVLKQMKESGLCDEDIIVFENELKTIVENEDIGIPASNWDRTDVDESLRLTAQWFQGKLDPSFYYRERNDEIFVEKIV